MLIERAAARLLHAWLFWQRFMQSTVHIRLRLLASAAVLVLIAAATAGCQTTQTADSTGALGASAPQAQSAALPAPDPNLNAARSDADWRREVQIYGQKYRAEPGKLDVAMHYAAALRATGQRAQAVAVLEHISIENPRDKAVLGAYGRALAEAGAFGQALEVLERAHSPDQPDWHILSAQGAVLDQMGRHADAQRYYLTALKIVPDESFSTLQSRAVLRIVEEPARGRDHAAPRRGETAGRSAGSPEILRWWSACKAVSPKQKQSRVPSCRRKKPRPMSAICGRCWPAGTSHASRHARTASRIPIPTPAR